MEAQYYINFQTFSLERLKNTLKTGDVLPGRQILIEDIEARFDILSSLGMKNLSDLITKLDTKQKIEHLSQQSGLPIEYLVILGREARSYKPKPVYLREISGVDSSDVEKLAELGITHSKHFFEHGKTKKKREELSRLTEISMEKLLELAKLSDLARIRGLGAAFTRLFYEAGAETLEKLSRFDPEELFHKVHAMNKEKRVTKTIPPLKDFYQYVEMAKDLPKVVEYD
jgi:predicted flap endonuclease-1-like 5' DNA nuclease